MSRGCDEDNPKLLQIPIGKWAPAGWALERDGVWGRGGWGGTKNNLTE